MKIVELLGFELKFPLSDPMGNARNLFRERNAFLLRIRAEDGTVGWGEAGNGTQAASAIIRRRLAGALLGQDTRSPRALLSVLRSKLGYDLSGSALMALSAVDMALHDLRARQLDISVSQLLGGALRDRIFTYASGPFVRRQPNPYEFYEQETEAYLRAGFQGIKLRAGIDPKSDGEIALRLRRQIGDDVLMAVDLNQAYVASTAAASAARMADADLAWLEEPVAQHDYAGYARLSQSLTTPISGGESLASIEAMRTLLDEGKVSILQPDLSIAGGYGGLARIQAFADAAHVPIMPHVFGTAVNLFASLQFASLLEPMRSGHAHPYPFFEFDMMDNPLLALGGMLKVDADSCLAIPQGPGIGLEFEPERLEPWIDHSWRQET